MCNHNNISIIPSIENSWGIDDTYNIKCITCGKILYKSITFDNIKDYINMIKPNNVRDLSNFL